ncbi:MAG TPA: ATP-dependent metallopeptidase FtsH/Yme1/Tma family protein, partial [Roseimicrobium sp.]|nr:ATP-dependent metallopeptidase FtsH/Yme1/Tma family protein [Roseimicrobium sp.]
MADPKQDKNPRKNGRLTPNGGGLKFGRGLFGWMLFVGLAIMFFMLMRQGRTTQNKIVYMEFINQLTNNNVVAVVIDGNEATGSLNDPKKVPGIAPGTNTFTTLIWPDQNVPGDIVVKILEKAPASCKLEFKSNTNIVINLLLPLIPWLLIFGFIYVFIFRQLRNSAGAGGMLGNFGRSRHKITSKEHTNITFD